MALEHGWRPVSRPNPMLGVTGMENRRPSLDCPLCKVWGEAYDEKEPHTLGRQHIHAAALWAEKDGRGDWPERVCRAAKDQAGVLCTPQQARRHYAYHRPEQPHPSGRLDRELALAEARLLAPAARNLITACYRQRILSKSQIVELFYDSYPPKSARALATRDLQNLCHRHFLYRFYPPASWGRGFGTLSALAGEAFYLLGQRGAPYVADCLGVRVWDDSITTLARQVKSRTFVHDWRAAQCYLAFDAALKRRTGVITLPTGIKTAAYTKRENWYGARLTQMRMWSRRAQKELDLRPDGFATLSLERAGYEQNSLPSCQLPFFYEYDNETKKEFVVADQMIAYHHLALSPELARRFPDLGVQGYAAPMIIIFRGDRGRVDRVARSFRRRAGSEGFRQGVPIFLVLEKDWMQDPFAEGIMRLAWDTRDEPIDLLDALLRSSSRLLAARALTAPQVLDVDPRPSPRRLVSREAEERTRKTKARAQGEEARARAGQKSPVKGPAKAATGGTAKEPKAVSAKEIEERARAARAEQTSGKGAAQGATTGSKAKAARAQGEIRDIFGDFQAAFERAEAILDPLADTARPAIGEPSHETEKASDETPILAPVTDILNAPDKAPSLSPLPATTTSKVTGKVTGKVASKETRKKEPKKATTSAGTEQRKAPSKDVSAARRQEELEGLAARKRQRGAAKEEEPEDFFNPEAALQRIKQAGPSKTSTKGQAKAPAKGAAGDAQKKGASGTETPRAGGTKKSPPAAKAAENKTGFSVREMLDKNEKA